MEWSRVKNLLIILLLLVNGFLFGAYLTTEISHKNDELSARSDIYQILLKRGISIDIKIIPLDSEYLYPARVERSRDEEQKIASALLGNVTAAESGGGKITYTGGSGSISFRVGGLFNLSMAPKTPVPSRDEAYDNLILILKKLNISTDRDKINITQKSDGYYTDILQMFSGINVFNCNNMVMIKSDGSVTVSGRRTPERILPARSVRPRSISGLILDFLDCLEEQKITITKISEIESGYITESVSGGDMNLVPIWRINANNEDYFLNALTGKLVTTE